MDKDQITNTTDMATAIPTITIQNNVFTTMNYILNSFSMLFSLFLIVIIIILKIKDINYSNRISLHLLLYISVTEVFFSISQMFRFDTNFFSTWNSYFSTWGYVFSTLLISFLIMSILVNIQLTFTTFTYNFKDITNIKKYYLIISLSLSIILSIIPVTFSKFTLNNERNYYWYESAAWEWTTYTGWITFIVFYCSISFVYILYRLNKNPQKFSQERLYSFSSDTSATLTSREHTQSKLISKYISRIVLYSLIPMLSYFPSLIFSLVRYSSSPFSLNLFSLICVSSQSIFTFAIFLFDPIIDEVILEHKRNVEHKKSVLDNIKKGVYVDNIYKIDRELPSSRNQNDQEESDNWDQNRRQGNKTNRKRYRDTIYFYARNAKNRISILTTTVLYSKKKSVDVGAKKEPFTFDNEVDEILSLL